MRQRHPEMTPPLSLALRRTSNLQNLNSLRKDELTIDTLLGHEANHAVTCEELSELLEGTGTTVTDVVVVVITEGHHVCRAERRRIDVIAHELVRLTSNAGRLPHESAVVVLEGTDSRNSCIVHDEGCVLSVRALQCINEVDDILRLRSSYGFSKGTATSLSEKAKRLTFTSTVEEGIFLGIGQSLTKLVDDVILKTEGVIIQQFLGYLDSDMELAYVKPRIGENIFGGESVTYEGVGGTKKWERIESYGPKFVENIVQAISRDILMYAMMALRNCSIVAHVHDEVIIEADPRMSIDSVCEQMGRVPPWAKGLLLDADGYECDFYKKD